MFYKFYFIMIILSLISFLMIFKTNLIFCSKLLHAVCKRHLCYIVHFCSSDTMSQENSLTLATIKDNIRKIRASYNLNDVSNSSGISCENEQMRTVEEQHHEEVFNHLEGNIHIKSVESSSHSLSVPLNVDCFVVATISNECSGICSSYARNSSSSVSYVDAKFSGGGIEQFFATNDKSKKSSIKENSMCLYLRHRCFHVYILLNVCC